MSLFSKPLFLLLLLVLFLVAAMAGSPSNGVESNVMQALADFRAEWPQLTKLVGGITTLGGAYVTLGVTAAASLWLLLRRAPAQALLLALTVLIERSLVDGLKEWIGRPRPSVGVDWLPSSLAYPSGHAANSMTAFLAAALIAAPPELRRTAAIAALALSLLVGLTRIWLGVHWPTDVIGGWSLGLLSVGAALLVGRRSAVLHFEPQHQIVGRHRPALGEDEAT